MAELVAPGIFRRRASQNPLSADIGVIEGEGCTWVFDAGNGEEAAAFLRAIPNPKNLVLSHFHGDHIGNWRAAPFGQVYQGAFTFRRTGTGIVVREGLWAGAVYLFPIPSTHAKGCVGLEAGEYAFLGDAAYCAQREGRPAYDVSLLAREIRVLEGLAARYFLLSHGEPFVREKGEVLEGLREIYRQRKPGEGWIFLD